MERGHGRDGVKEGGGIGGGGGGERLDFDKAERAEGVVGGCILDSPDLYSRWKESSK